MKSEKDIQTDRRLTHTPVPAQNIAATWRTRASWLARWSMYHLVNRKDIWGRYVAEEKRGIRPDGRIAYGRIAPSRKRRGQMMLTESLLMRHFMGEKPEHLIGLQSISAKGMSRWLVLDFHRQPAQAAEETFHAAKHVYDDLVAGGFLPVLTDCNGLGGYHLWLLFDQAVEADRVAALGHKISEDARRFGLHTPPVSYPDAKASDTGGKSNWIRLPGRHYANNHWTQVWNGRSWLNGADAIEALLHAHGDSVQLLMRDVRFISHRRAEKETAREAASPTVANGARPATNGHEDPATLVSRDKAFAYLQNIRVERARAYHQWLRLGMALHDIDASDVMMNQWDQWSQSTPHYSAGLCTQHWRTFSGSGDRESALALLDEWAREDAATTAAEQPAIPDVPPPPVVTDPDLQEVVRGWDSLPAAVKTVVLNMIRGQ